MSSIDQALAAVDASCPPMTSSEPDYYYNDNYSGGNRDRENISPINRNKESVNPVLIDALVKKVNQAITPPSNTNKDRDHDLHRGREGMVFDTRRILDGLPPVVNHNTNHPERDDFLPTEMSMASIDYLRRHNLLLSRRSIQDTRKGDYNDSYRSGTGTTRRSLD